MSPYSTIFQYSFFEDAPYSEKELIFRTIAFAADIKLPKSIEHLTTIDLNKDVPQAG